MMPVWPAAFLQSPGLRGWETEPFETRSEFTPEAGPPLFRARFTAEAWSARATFPSVDETEYAAFLAFRQETRRGALQFLWRDPDGGGAPRVWQFAAPPRVTKISPTRRDVVLSLILLPSRPWWTTLIPTDRLVAPVAAYDLQRGLYHNGTAQVGATAAISTPVPGLVTAHGLSDVRLLTVGGAATVILGATLTAGWWPASPPPDLASITVFAPGALA